RPLFLSSAAYGYGVTFLDVRAAAPGAEPVLAPLESPATEPAGVTTPDPSDPQSAGPAAPAAPPALPFAFRDGFVVVSTGGGDDTVRVLAGPEGPGGSRVGLEWNGTLYVLDLSPFPPGAGLWVDAGAGDDRVE